MDVFTLGINHGVGPKDGSYAYISAGKTSAQRDEGLSKKNAIEILSNNPKIQAVRNTKLNVWMVTFFEAGTFKHKELWCYRRQAMRIDGKRHRLNRPICILPTRTNSVAHSSGTENR